MSRRECNEGENEYCSLIRAIAGRSALIELCPISLPLHIPTKDVSLESEPAIGAGIEIMYQQFALQDLHSEVLHRVENIVVHS